MVMFIAFVISGSLLGGGGGGGGSFGGDHSGGMQQNFSGDSVSVFCMQFVIISEKIMNS
jgi:hypothetical protein